MANPIDWLAGELTATDNILGSALGWAVRGRLGIPQAIRGGGSLLRGVGSLRDRMSQRDSGFDSWDMGDTTSPQKVHSSDGGLGDSGEVLTRLTNIENILRSMSALAVKSDVREIAAVEEGRQNEEALHRSIEQHADPDTMSPVRLVEQEREESSSFFGSLVGVVMGLMGPKSKLFLAIGGLAAAATAAKLAWDKLSPDTDLPKAFMDSATAVGVVINPGAAVAEQMAAAGGDVVRAGIDALDRGVSPGVVATQTAQSGLNFPKAIGLGARVPWHAGTAGWRAGASLGAGAARTAANWLAPSPTGIFSSRAVNPFTSTAGTIPSMINPKTAKPFGVPGSGPAAAVPDNVEKKVGQSIWQRLMASRIMESIMQSKWMPSLSKLRLFGTTVGRAVTAVQGGQALWDFTQGNYGQSATGGLAAGLMASRHPLYGAAGLTLSTALSDYKTQDESKQNILGMLLGDQIGDWGRGGIGTGMMSDTMGAWLHRGLSGIGLGGESLSLDSVERMEEEARKWRPAGSPLGQSEKHRFVKTKLMDDGYGHEQSEGIIKNLIDESRLDERAVGDSGTALGIAQWRGDRADNMKAFVGKRPEMARLEAEVGFLIRELGQYGGSPEEMPKDFAGAHNWVLQKYEIPADIYRLSPEELEARGLRTDRTRFVVDDIPPLAMDGTPPAGRNVGGLTAEGGEAATQPIIVSDNSTRIGPTTNHHTTVVSPPLNANNPEIAIWLYQKEQGLNT